VGVIGLEVSTSQTKAVLYSPKGEQIAECIEPLTSDIAQVDWQSPRGIFLSVLRCLKKVVGFDKNPDSIQAIGLGGIWHSLLLLDDRRRPLESIRTWADLLTPEIIDTNEAQKLVPMVYRKTGCVGHGMYPFWKLYAMKEHNFDLLEKVRFISSQIEFLFQNLTGEIAVSGCTASGSGLFNLHTKKWDEELLCLLDLDLEMLPRIEEIYYVGHLKGDLAKQIGLKTGIPVTVGCPDGALNQIGSGALDEGIMTFSVGTSGALRQISAKPVMAENLSSWCYYFADEMYLVGAATHATSNLEWFMKSFHLKETDHYRLQLAASALEINEGPLFLPFLYGERAPGWRANRTGGFLSLQADHTIIHLYKAVLEGILFALYHSYLELIKVVEIPMKIRLSGGIIRSSYWRQMAADIFGRELDFSAHPNESTKGAGLLALQVSGQLGDIRNLTFSLSGTTVPDLKNHELYLQRFAHYLESYASQ